MAHRIDNLESTSEAAVCPECVSLVSTRDPFCMKCARARPLRGWPLLADESDPWLGRTIAGQYLATQRLGVGGTARVYRVESAKLARRFALKVVDLDATKMGDSTEVEQRIRREIEVVRRLHNPHIVPLFDVLRVGRRSVGMLMGLAEGRTLQEIVRTGGALSVIDALDVVRQIATALTEPHNLGITHRDVKPENLMLQQLATGPFVRVMDFGIAHVDDEAGLTRGFIGTPLYASPEQIEGTRVGPASDVYSTGATLYFALTGVAPFSHTSHIAALRAHIIDPVPRLSDAAGRFFSVELEDLVSRMLAKDPADRPQDMPALVEELDHLQECAGFDEVFGEPSDVSSMLVGMSETVSEARTTGDHKPLGFCMAPFHIEGEFSSGGLAAMGSGRIVSIVDNDVIVTRPNSDLQDRRATAFAAQATAVAASDTGLFVGTRDGRVWGDEDEWRAIFETRDDPISAVAVTPAADTIAVGTVGGDIFVRTGESDWNFLATGSPVRAVALSPSASSLAVATWAGVRVTDLQTGESFVIPVADVTSVCFSADEYLLATATRSSHVTIWGVGAQKANRLHVVDRQGATVLSLYFANDTLLGLCRNSHGAFLVDMQCNQSHHCAPLQLKCDEKA